MFRVEAVAAVEVPTTNFWHLRLCGATSLASDLQQSPQGPHTRGFGLEARLSQVL